MNGPKSLAIVINQVEDDDRFTTSNDDLCAALRAWSSVPETPTLMPRWRGSLPSTKQGEGDEITLFVLPHRVLR